MPDIYDEMETWAGVHEPKEVKDSKLDSIYSEMEQFAGIKPAAKKQETKPEESSFVMDVIGKGLANTPEALVARAISPDGYVDEDLGTVGNIGSEIVSFVGSPTTYLTGGLGNIAARGLIKEGAKVAGKETLKRLAARGAIAAGTQLGALEAIKDPARQYIETGTVNPLQTAANVGKATVAGAALGPAGLVQNPLLRAGAEVGTMAETSALLEGQLLPNQQQWIHAAGTVGGFKLAHVVTNVFKSLKPGQDPKPALAKEIGAENAQKIEEEMARMATRPPAAVDDATRNLAALADKETVTRKEYMAATGVKQVDVPVAEERKAQAQAAKEKVDASKSISDVRNAEEEVRQNLSREDNERGGQAGPIVPSEEEARNTVAGQVIDSGRPAVEVGGRGENGPGGQVALSRAEQRVIEADAAYQTARRSLDAYAKGRDPKILASDETYAALKAVADSAKRSRSTAEANRTKAIGKGPPVTPEEKAVRQPLHDIPEEIARTMQQEAEIQLENAKSEKTKIALRKIIEDAGRDVGAAVEKQKQRLLDILSGKIDQRTIFQKQVGYPERPPNETIESYLAGEPVEDTSFNFGANAAQRPGLFGQETFDAMTGRQRELQMEAAPESNLPDISGQQTFAPLPGDQLPVTPAGQAGGKANTRAVRAQAEADAAWQDFDKHTKRNQQLGSTGGGVDPKAISLFVRAATKSLKAKGYQFSEWISDMAGRIGSSTVRSFRKHIEEIWNAERPGEPIGDVEAILANLEAPAAPKEIARPDLAVPVQNQEAATALNVGDTIRNVAEEPRRISHSEADTTANQMIAEQGPDLARRLIDGEWQQETSADTFAQIKTLNALGQQARETGNRYNLIRAALNYRQARTQVAQALEAGKNAVMETMTQPEQQAFFNHQALVQPPPKVEKLILKLQAEEAEATRKGEAPTTKGKKKTAEQVTKEWEQKVRSVEARLKALGHDVEAALTGNLNRQAQREFERDVHALKASVPDKLHEWWSNAILSGPATQIVNAVGNVANAGWHFTGERITDAVLGSMARAAGLKYNGATFGELKPIYRAFVENLGKSAANFFETWHSEIPTFYRMRGMETETAYGHKPGAIAGTKGKVIRTPWRLLAAVDDFVKTQVYEMERASLAYRQANAEGLKGDALTARMRELLDSSNSAINARATDTTIRLAFQESTPFAKGVARVVNTIPGGRYVLPFITTPFNIMKAGIRKSPFGSIKLAKEVLKAHESGDWSNISQRTAEQVLAWGATLALLYSNDPKNPWLTGGDDPNRKYAIKLGGNWYNYSRIEPFATTLGLLVDATNKFREGHDLFDSLKAPFTALAQRIDDQTFFTGLSDFMKAATDPENAVDHIMQWAAKFPASWVPNLIRAPFRNLQGEVPQRRVWGKGEERVDRILDRGLKAFEVMPDYPKYDLWGRVVPKDGSTIPHTDWLFRTLSPVGERKYVETVGDRILTKWNAAHPDEKVEMRPPNPYFSEGGKTFYFTDDEYATYVRESGKLTMEKVLDAQRLNKFNLNEPTEKDIKRLKGIIESSRDKVRNAIKKSRRKQAKEAA